MIIDIIFIILASIVVLFLLFWKFYFLRDPERNITKGDNLVSPADGKVLKIMKYDVKKEITEPKLIEKKTFGKIKTMLSDISEKGHIVSIFMSPLNVHVNRSPMKGKIISQKHINGKFYKAFNFEKTLFNEKNEIIIQDGKTKIKVIQIAGAVARRIESFVKEGDKVQKGERIGLINLGSQVTIILPEKFKVEVKEGEKTIAGVTVIAK